MSSPVGLGMRLLFTPWGQVCPSNYDYGARCTPSLGGRGVVVNFNPTLSPRRSRPPNLNSNYDS